MTDTTTTGVTAPKTPPPGVDPAPALKSTPLAVGSATVSEHISTVGLNVNNVCPWIGRDVENYRECPVDNMLGELLYRCADPSQPPPDRSTLLSDCLEAVLPICNDGDDAKTIKEHLGALVASTVEQQMYKPFIQASNFALNRLSTLDVPGLVCSKAHDDDTIIFHQNDPKNITQEHQGEKSTRKPDVVIVSRTCAVKVRKQSSQGKPYNDEEALKTPSQQFQWTDVRSTVEFKYKKTRPSLQTPPTTYAVKDYDVPEAKKYINYRRETNHTVEPTEPAPLPDGGAAANPRQTSETGEHPTQVRAQNDKKRNPDQALDSHNSKRLKVDDEKEPLKEAQRIHAVLQNGLYAAELFSAHVVRQSVITYVVNNDMIYLWYFDRQGAIQCSGINFVQDLPRFMVLLLAIQRMPYAEWGYNRLFEHVGGSLDKLQVQDNEEQFEVVDLEFDWKSDKRITHFGLRGRATTVFPVKSQRLSDLVQELPHHNPHNPTKELVAKIYWPEEERESEADILQKVYKIAQEDTEGKVKYHVPEMVWSHKFEDTSTANIRRALGLENADRGRRVLYIIVFRKLDPITNLSDKEFLAAWWHIVVCHYALWGNKVHHRDVSPSNLMVYRTLDGRYVGVLNDFDLSSTRHSPSGQERTGTVPFMAIELLTTEAIKGQATHLYRHDAESFIWVLTWISLRYQEGQQLRGGRPLDEWLKVDINTCREKKNDFLYTGRRGSRPSSSHTDSWKVARSCLRRVGRFYLDNADSSDSEGEVHSPPQTDAAIFEKWLERKILKVLTPEDLNVRVESASL